METEAKKLDVRTFQCEQCSAYIWIENGWENDKAFCNNCGACYKWTWMDHGIEIRRIKFAEGHMELSEWSEIFADGYIEGRHDEAKFRQCRPLWKRLKDAILNRGVSIALEEHNVR